MLCSFSCPSPSKSHTSLSHFHARYTCPHFAVGTPRVAGHTVKHSSVQQSKACVALEASRRWCCTGTPINNAIDDLVGQFAAIHLHPLNWNSFFDAHIKPAFSGSYYQEGGAAPLLYVLRRVMIRHTKQQVIAGEEVLKLPPKTEELVPGKAVASLTPEQ